MTKYREFVFVGYHFDEITGRATFKYNFDDTRWFEETVQFKKPELNYNKAVLSRALFTAFVIAGISYYKCFPTSSVRLRRGSFSNIEAAFFSKMYRDGLSQFVYENNLTPDVIATFRGDHIKQPLPYAGKGVVALQSGGKDSLLLAELLKIAAYNFTSEYMRQGPSYPIVIDDIRMPVRSFKRTIDRRALENAINAGGLNGHVPITFIVMAYTLVDAVLNGENTVVTAIGQEGEEPYAYIANYAIRHQWAKTWTSEQLFTNYVHESISSNFYIGSPLRSYTEVKIAKLFVENCWQKYKHGFSSCNVANYKLGQNNQILYWCGECPKCANSFLLFAPFVSSAELEPMFNGNMFAKPHLVRIFKGLLDIDDMEKPFECVGTTAELRKAYELALTNNYSGLPFKVPRSDFDMNYPGPAQEWAIKMIE